MMSGDTFTLSDIRKAEGGSFSLADIGKADPYDVSPARASAMNIAQALTFNSMDNIMGAMGRADPARYRATIDKFKTEYPYSAIAGSVSGSALMPFGLGKAVSATMNPYSVAAATGGLSAGLNAAGDSEDSKKPGQKIINESTAGMMLGPLAMLGMKGTGSIAEAIAPRIPGVGDDLTRYLARNRVVEAFQRDNVSPDEALSRARSLGPEARLYDGGGDSVHGALDVNATLPGQTGQRVKDAIRSRQAEEFDRLSPVVDTVSNNQGRASANMSMWQQIKQKESAPLYEAFTKNPVPNNPQLAQLLQTAETRGLTKKAAELHELETNNPFSFSAVDQYQDPKALNYIKQAVDDKIEQALAQGDGNLVRALNMYKTNLVKAVDRASGGLYKPALDAFSGPAALQSALTAGRRFWSSKPDDLGITMRGLSSSEQEAFRIGAAEALREKIGGRAGRTELINIWQNNNTREKLQELLGDDVKFSDVEKLLLDAGKLRRLEGVGQGSQTARREAGMEDQALGVAADMVQAVGNAKAGNIPGLLTTASRRLGTPEPVRNEIGRLLLSRNLSEEIQKLKEAQELMKRMNMVRGSGSGLIAGSVTDRYM